MRVLVTGGSAGQVAGSLLERASHHGATVMALGRPELDLLQPHSVEAAVRQTNPDIIVNAAAYTAVDKAEVEPELAERLNGGGALAAAQAARERGIPIVQLSTDYVFPGDLDRAYREDDPVGPLSAYGHSKLAGERAIANTHPDHAILRTAWVYSPFGTNFVRTMLRLAATRQEISVVADQHGSPTSALDIADAVLQVCRNLLVSPSDPKLRGLFHMVGSGATTWAEFAEFIFAYSGPRGGPSARVRRITTPEYPTAARRPPNSRLNCEKLAATHGIRLPDWHQSAPACIERLL
jgi:dTDP-4-dehydrorhamnose reductase